MSEGGERIQVCPSHALLMTELARLGYPDEQWGRMCPICAAPYLQAQFEWEEMMS